MLVKVSEMGLVVHEFEVPHALLLSLDAHVQVVTSRSLFVRAGCVLGVHCVEPIFNHFKSA